jgi:hypothetical protein
MGMLVCTSYSIARKVVSSKVPCVTDLRYSSSCDPTRLNRDAVDLENPRGVS